MSITTLKTGKCASCGGDLVWPSDKLPYHPFEVNVDNCTALVRIPGTTSLSRDVLAEDFIEDPDPTEGMVDIEPRILVEVMSMQGMERKYIDQILVLIEVYRRIGPHDDLVLARDLDKTVIGSTIEIIDGPRGRVTDFNDQIAIQVVIRNKMHKLSSHDWVVVYG
jgi:hypothetical protein